MQASPTQSIVDNGTKLNRITMGARPWSDADLVAAAIGHQDWAWQALIERYGSLVDSITWSHRLNRADAVEARQEVWTRLFESLDRVRKPECLAGWIRVVTSHECVRKLGKYRPETTTGDAARFEHASDDELDAPILARERQAAVRRALIVLPSRGKALIQALLHEPDLSYKALAVRLDIPVGSQATGGVVGAPTVHRLVDEGWSPTLLPAARR